MPQCARLLLAVLLLIGVAGCPSLRPSWFHPGPEELQRAKAIQHDPYPDKNAGPEVVGGRPLQFQNQRSEAIRNQPYPYFRAPGP